MLVINVQSFLGTVFGRFSEDLRHLQREREREQLHKDKGRVEVMLIKGEHWGGGGGVEGLVESNNNFCFCCFRTCNNDQYVVSGIIKII